MKHIQFTRQGLGIVVAYPGFLFIALLRGATDGKPVVGYYHSTNLRSVNRIYRPFGGK
jgi:hypothetical protein